MSPYCFAGSANVFYVYSTGDLSNSGVYSTTVVRPAVSLRPGVKVTSEGDGTMENPYIVVE